MAPELPFVDEHSVEIEAPPALTWTALVEVTAGSFKESPGLRLLARPWGLAEPRASGEPGVEGSTVVGFRVVRSDPPRELLLAGSHRFSTYSLGFRLDELPGDRSRVTAITRAEFPGAKGRAYRALVIGTRGHVLAVRRMLSAVKRRAERSRVIAGA